VIALLQANFFPLAAALLIGVATARWTFRRPPSGPDKT
jgi:hypothetical protein